MTDIIERLRIESRREPHEPIWRDAIDEIEALRVEVVAQRTRADAMAGEAIKHEDRAERLERGLRYAVRVWVLPDEIEWSEEEIDKAVERIIDSAKKEAGRG